MNQHFHKISFYFSHDKNGQVHSSLLSALSMRDLYNSEDVSNGRSRPEK